MGVQLLTSLGIATTEEEGTLLPELYLYGLSRGGYALTALSSLTHPDREAIVRTLEARLDWNGGFTEPDSWTAMRAATPATIPAIRRRQTLIMREPSAWQDRPWTSMHGDGSMPPS